MRKKIAVLIPEFPVQTHAFFMREREQLNQLGVDTVLVSTRRPDGQHGIASHEWAENAIKETKYLFPLSILETLSLLMSFILTGPAGWQRCYNAIRSSDYRTFKERITNLGFILVAIKLLRYCRANDITHVHVHSCANAANVAMFSALLHGPSYSLTLHGPLIDYGPNQSNKWKHAAFGIVITTDLKNELEQTLNPEELPPVSLAPMGVDINSFKRQQPYKYHQTDEPIRLVSCGRLNYVKAHDDLIRVVALLKNKGQHCVLRICGAMDAPSQKVNYKNELEQLARDLDVYDDITFLGSVSEQHVKQELSDAHFFCLASLKEPLGVATMEAMAMEIPVIVCKSPGVEEMVSDGKDGFLVEPRTPQQFVDCILEAIKAPELIAQMITSGRAKVTQKFHSGISAQKIYEGIEQLVNHHGNQQPNDGQDAT